MIKSIRKYWMVAIVAVALIAGSVERSMATSLTIENADFSFGTIGWDGSGRWGVWDPAASAFDVEPDGNVAWANYGYISQVLPYNLTAGHLYTLSVDVGHQLLSSCGTCTSYGYSVELLAGGVSFLSVSGNGTAGSWQNVTGDRLATADGGQLEIRLHTDGRRTHFDNVALNNCTVASEPCGDPAAAIPEPATLLLLGSGLLGVALFGKKKFKGFRS